MAESAGKKSPYILSSLDNALKVLDILSVKDNVSLAELTKISKLDKTSLFKILFTLERRDYVLKTADARYRLGVKFSNYGELISERQSLAELSTPFMRRLRDLCRETVYLGVLNTNGRVIIMHMEAGSAPDSIVTRIGYEMDAHSNAMGKVLLAWLEPGMQNSMVESLTFRVYTKTTVGSAEELRPVLETVRAQGWGEDDSERYPDRSAVAVPVFDRSGRCVAALSIVCRDDRFKRCKERYMEDLLRAAEDISHKLGY